MLRSSAKVEGVLITSGMISFNLLHVSSSQWPQHEMLSACKRVLASCQAFTCTFKGLLEYLLTVLLSELWVWWMWLGGFDGYKLKARGHGAIRKWWTREWGLLLEESRLQLH